MDRISLQPFLHLLPIMLRQYWNFHEIERRPSIDSPQWHFDFGPLRQTMIVMCTTTTSATTLVSISLVGTWSFANHATAMMSVGIEMG
jgi:hypothetical protein